METKLLKKSLQIIESTPFIEQPIPTEAGNDDGCHCLRIEENGEPVIPVSAPLYCDVQYFHRQLGSPYITDLSLAVETMGLRKSVVKQLLQAQELLQTQDPDLYLAILDAYRPLDYQESLFNQYCAGLARDNSKWTKEEVLAEACKFVATPSHDPAFPPPHLTGGAVDITILCLPAAIAAEVRKIDAQLAGLKNPADKEEIAKLTTKRTALFESHRQYLDMGHSMNDRHASALAYYETIASPTAKEREVRANRRLLYQVMARVTMQPYCYEWWHWSSDKVQMGAIVAGKDKAEFGALFFERHGNRLVFK